MESIGNLLKQSIPKTKIDQRGNQPRQVLVEKIMYELDIPREETWKGKKTDNFKRIFFSGLTDATLEKIWQDARAWKVNPKAFFWKLLKEAKKVKP
jgi:hypothetical protein